MLRIAVATLLALALFSIAGACLRIDPSHCANREGDKTCAELGSGPFCSICASENSGCVDEGPPADSCYRPGAAATATETDAPTTSAMTTTDSGVCTGDGLDETCPVETPYCLAGECVPCSAESAEICGDQHCHPDSGHCVACVDDTDCESQLCDDAFSCVGCTRHSDCPESACNLATAACMPTANVFYVDLSAGCSEPGFGTEVQPYCSFVVALDEIGSSQTGVINVLAGELPSESIDIRGTSDRTVAILGVGEIALGSTPTPVRIDAGSSLFLSGLNVADANDKGIECAGGATVWLTDVRLSQHRVAIEADDCTVTLDRTVVSGSLQDAIAAENSRVTVHASAIVDGGSADADTAALRLSNTELRVSYSTIVGNRSNVRHASVFCDDASTGEVRNSIVAAAAPPSLSCDGAFTTTSVVDSELTDAVEVEVVEGYDDSWFVDAAAGDVTLADPASSPFEDVAVWAVGNPRHDISGTRRNAYHGLREFAGAAQP